MDNAQAVAVRATGEIVFAGVSGAVSGFQMTVGQLLPDGSLDANFGTGGITTYQAAGGSCFGYDVVIEDDGHVLVCGAVSLSPSNTAFAVWRLNPDGSFDADFADGGALVVDIDESEDYAQDLLVHEGQITAIGSSMQPDNGLYRAAMVRFDETGNVAPFFGNGGVQIYPETTTSNYDIRGGTVGDNGDLYLVGYTSVSWMSNPIVARFTSEGMADMDYGVGGFFNPGVEGRYFDAAFQDGRLVAVGDANNGSNGVVRAHGAGGVVDVTFGEGGEVLVGPGGANTLLAIEVQADGKWLVGGSGATGFLMREFLVAGLEEDGALDAAFGTDGVTVRVVGPGFGAVTDLAIQPDGLIIAAGFAQISNNDFVFARYGMGELGAISGCTDPSACNYDALASEDDASCYGEGDPCDDGLSETVNDQYTADCECAGEIVGVDEWVGHAATVFPNPAQDRMTVRFERLAADRVVRLVDAGGRVLLESRVPGTQLDWDLSDCPAGIYTLTIEDASGASVRRVAIR